jgi:PAS domain S-box-containing protein
MKILHIEDNENDSFLIQRVLKSNLSGVDYKCVDSLSEFKQEIQAFKPDVVLSDHNLRGFSSIEVFMEFKKLKWECPFILITSAISEEFAIETLRNGVDDYILKDHLERLPKSIENLIQKYKLVEEREEYIQQIISSEERYKDLLQSTSELIHSADILGKIAFVNESWKKSLGYTLQEVLGKNIFDFIEDESKITCQAKFIRIMSGEKVDSMRIKMIGKNGRLRIMEGLGVPRILDGKIIGSHAFLKDVTEKEKIEEALGESEKRYSLAIEATADGIFDFDIKNRNFYYSKHCFEILNLKPVVISIRKLPKATPPEFYIWIKERIASSNGSETESIFFEKDIQIQTSPIKWVNIRAVFKGSDCRINGSIRNITDKKLQELEIQQLNKDLENKVEARTSQLKVANQLLIFQNKEINDSIVYSKRIHDALLPSELRFNDIFPDSFVIDRPKNLIGGDFAWFQKIDCLKFIAAVDCTGHGVPGALLSVISIILLDEAVLKQNLRSPVEILNYLDSRLSSLFQHSGEIINDGMDIALCCFDEKYKRIYFAGAQRPLYIQSDEEIVKIHGTKKSIGYNSSDIPFELFESNYLPGDNFFMFSDGVTSQFGGPTGKKLKGQQFRQLLHTLSNEINKKEAIENYLNVWQGDLEQTDDILIIGLKAT